MARANARSTVVLPTPTSPSSSTWPRANKATLIMRSVSGWPITAQATLLSTRKARSRQSCSNSSARRIGIEHAALARLRLQLAELADLRLQRFGVADRVAALPRDGGRIGGGAHGHEVVVGHRACNRVDDTGTLVQHLVVAARLLAHAALDVGDQFGRRVVVGVDPCGQGQQCGGDPVEAFHGFVSSMVSVRSASGAAPSVPAARVALAWYTPPGTASDSTNAYSVAACSLKRARNGSSRNGATRTVRAGTLAPPQRMLPSLTMAASTSDCRMRLRKCAAWPLVVRCSR